MMLNIRLFGGFHILDEDGRALAIATPRMQSLIAYLLLHQDSPQPRQQIAVQLWPETGEAQARTNLRNLHHRLKSAFPTLEGRILQEHGALQWPLGEEAWLDVAAFRASVAEAKSSGGVPLAALQRAVDLYRGDLLPGCYDDWILPLREELRQAYLDVLERLVLLLEAQGDHRLAIDYAQLSLRNDPLNEVIYRHLIRLHGLSGDRTGGLRVYHTCAAVLEQALGVEPSAATRQTYLALLEEPATEPAPAKAGPPAASKGSLPYPLTSFIGREKEVEEVLRLLQSNRLLTLTGAPGAGKTRFGLEVAARLRKDASQQTEPFPDGVWWVDLTASTDLASITQAVAGALGVQENLEASPSQTLITWIGEHELLLVLDNAEHVMDALANFISAALRACPLLRFMITSREVLSIAGEVAWNIPPMSYPGPHKTHTPDSLWRYEAVRLFVERASAAMPTFRLAPHNAAAVAQICTHLEGIPLAIELAAARVKMMTAEQIAARIQEALLRLLRSGRGGGPEHHQTIEAAIAWSYQLLSEKERMLLRRLSVFSGGFSLEAAEQVALCCSPGDAQDAMQAGEVLELLSRLIDRSLVKVTASELAHAARYTLLEMIRQYADERLQEAGEVDSTRKRHAGYCVLLAEEADRNVRGPQQAAWLQRLEADHDNLRKALHWAVESGQEETALRLVNSLWQFWDIRGYFREGREWLRRALEMGFARTALRAKAFKGAGALAWSQSDYGEARERMLDSLEIYRQLGEPRDLAVGLFNMGLVTYSQGDYALAEPTLRESLTLFQSLDHKQGIANALNSLGVIADARGDFQSARQLYEESLATRRTLGDQRGMAISCGNLGMAAMHLGDFDEAAHFLGESLQRYTEIGDKRGSATTLNELGQLAHLQGQSALAYRHCWQALVLWQELGSRGGLATSFEGIAMAAAKAPAADHAFLVSAVQLLRVAETLRAVANTPLPPSDEPPVRQALDRLRERLGPDAFARAWQQARHMEQEQAIAAASMISQAE
jgi:predicted ATPase/DNA-binding SARP family transcriptional activator